MADTKVFKCKQCGDTYWTADSPAGCEGCGGDLEDITPKEWHEDLQKKRGNKAKKYVKR